MNNVHLFQQQYDKLYLCFTFGLFAWTLLSNVSQLGLLLTRKPSKQLSNRQCFLDMVLFKSITKGHFLTLHSPPLLPFSSSPSSHWPKKIKNFKLHFLCALCKHCKSKALPRLAQEAAVHHPTGKAAHQTLAKHPRNPSVTYRSSGVSGGPDWPPRNVTLLKLFYLQISPSCSRTTASLSFQDCCVLQPAAEILMLLLYFRERKKA